MSTAIEQQYDERVDEAFAIETQIKVAMADGRDALWRLTEALYHFNECSGWIRLNYDSLGEWLADPEITMTESTYWERVKVWRELVVHRGINPERLRRLDLSKTAIVVRGITGKRANPMVLVKDALADVEVLGARDLKQKYRPAGKESSSPNVRGPEQPDTSPSASASESAGTVEVSHPEPEPYDELRAEAAVVADPCSVTFEEAEYELQQEVSHAKANGSDRVEVSLASGEALLDRP
jgi:hypothetical protein